MVLFLAHTGQGDGRRGAAGRLAQAGSAVRQIGEFYDAPVQALRKPPQQRAARAGDDKRGVRRKLPARQHKRQGVVDEPQLRLR